MDVWMYVYAYILGMEVFNHIYLVLREEQGVRYLQHPNTTFCLFFFFLYIFIFSLFKIQIEKWKEKVMREKVKSRKSERKVYAIKISHNNGKFFLLNSQHLYSRSWIKQIKNSMHILHLFDRKSKYHIKEMYLFCAKKETVTKNFFVFRVKCFWEFNRKRKNKSSKIHSKWQAIE